MNRKLKKILSRFSLVALTIILLFVLDFVLFIGIFYMLEHVLIQHFPEIDKVLNIVIAVVAWLIVSVTVLHAANRDMVPEAKIPWIITIIVLNIFGVAIYIVFSYNRPSRRQRRIYGRVAERSKQNAGERPISKEETERALGRWADVSEALCVASPAAVLYGNTKTEYFPSGEVFAERFLGDLERAEKYIFLEYFIIAKGEFWTRLLGVLERKAKEGVEVRILYDDIGSMSRVHMNYHRTLAKKGIKCVKFNPFLPVVTVVHNNRDHRKIAVIDGKIGYTGGINLADEYMNITHPYGYFKDTAIRLEGEAVKSLVLMFLQLYNMRNEEWEDFSSYLPETGETFEGEGFVQPYGDGPRPFYGRQLGEDVYINIINGAKRYVYISTPYLIIDYRMREALILAAQRGVDVRLLTPAVPDKKIAFSLTRSNYSALIKGGVKIYAYTPGFVHAKSFVADDEVAVVGTINLDYRSFLFHFEDAVLMYRTRALVSLKQDMEQSFGQSALLTEEDAKKNVVMRLICEIAKIFAPLF